MEERGYLALQLLTTVHHHRKSGQELKQAKNLEVGVDAKAIHGGKILTGLLLVP